MRAKPRPLWRCPKCGARFVTKNMWHSCGRFTLEALFAKAEPTTLRLFRKYAALVRRCGAVTMIPQKSRAVFMARVRFAAVYPRRDGFVATFNLMRRITHERIVKHERFGQCHVHSVRIVGTQGLDATLASWLREAYRDYGQQRGLAISNA